MNKTFYISTTLPYVNSEPHIGFAMEVIRADVMCRYKKLLGYDVFFNTGTDEHGVKVLSKAKDEDMDVQSYVDQNAEKFKNLKELLGLSEDINFIRTTDARHIESAQAFWRKCNDAGDIYKKNYKVKYCVGCELEKTDSELQDGRCPIHLNMDLIIIEEENYFFRFSKYQELLLKHYSENPDFVVPDFRYNEIKRFVERGLEDFSISRLKEKMPWGVPVPDDDDHVMYVWFDALVNYVSAIGWPDDMETFDRYWPVVQYAGKDNLRQQSAMWQAMLMSAGLSLSKKIVINGFILSNGQKMSKSLGNVVHPKDIVQKYGSETLRYYLTRHTHPFEDSDFTEERLKDSYTGNLANGLGNLASRILKMYVSYGVEVYFQEPGEIIMDEEAKEYREAMDTHDLSKTMEFVWKEMGDLDLYIQETEPFKLFKEDPDMAKEIVAYLALRLHDIAVYLLPFMPDTAERIREHLNQKTMPEPLFPRKE
jgi:methionyl-tRNA synthetase